MTTSARLVFEGSFNPASFAEFVRHRASRLSIGAELATAGPTRIEVRVSGDRDLLDMFEVACWLGPLDCIVGDVRRIG